MRESDEYAVGSSVRHRATGEVGVVTGRLGVEVQVAFGGGLRYLAPRDVEQVVDPLRALAAGQVDNSDAAFVRLLATLLEHASRFDPGATLHNARLEPQLHQLFVAHRVVAEKTAPRMILADEVGLGKTIEAGLILKELRARKSLNRALVVTPASLTAQWQTELEAKFNERFEILDGAAAKHFGRNGANPFAALDNVICSLPFAIQEKRAEQIVEAGWDMVVFDEAHRVRKIGVGSAATTTTRAYRLAEDLRDHVDGLLLLSATPVQLDPSELFNLIELVEPGLFTSYASFRERRAQIPDLNDLMHTVERWTTLSPDDREAALTRHAALIGQLPDVDLKLLHDPAERERVKNALAVFHPLAYAMVRNRKRELNLAGQRRAELRLVPLTDIELELYEEVSEYLRVGYDAATREKNLAVGFLMVIYQKMLTSSSNALRVSFRRRIDKLRAQLGKAAAKTADATVDREDPDELSTLALDLDGAGLASAELRAEIALLTDLALRLDDVRDSKLAHAVTLVEELRAGAESGQGRKIVVFTQFVETQAILAKTLELAGHRVAVFNGRQSAEEKENAIRAFRERADVLVSTEAGGEGRNLQFASALVNYDLPWNPMKVEQRIGRLDRIGQKDIVEIFNLVAEGTLEERIVAVLDERIRLFEESVGSLDPILTSVEHEIKALAMAEPVAQAAGFDKLGASYEVQVEQARLAERTMADFVLDRASFRRDRAAALLDASELTQAGDVRRVVEASLDYLGGSVMEHSEGGATIALPPRVATQLGQSRPGHHGVFDPAEALQRDDLVFFALGHPLIDRILETARTLPGSTIGARRSADVPAGTWVEVIWRITSHLIVQEAVMVRHLIGPDGTVHVSPLHRLPISDRPLTVSAPDWLAAAVAASTAAFGTELAGHRTVQEERHAEVRAERSRREARMFAAREHAVQRRISGEALWLSERAHDDVSTKDRRVMPAREGRLRKLREELAALSDERVARLALIESATLALDADVLSAGLVVGSGPDGMWR